MQTTHKKSPVAVQYSRLNKKVKAARKKGLTDTQRTIIIVSLAWLLVGGIVVAFLVNSQAQYNRGVFDGMTKTRNILQSK